MGTGAWVPTGQSFKFSVAGFLVASPGFGVICISTCLAFVLCSSRHVPRACGDEGGGAAAPGSCQGPSKGETSGWRGHAGRGRYPACSRDGGAEVTGSTEPPERVPPWAGSAGRTGCSPWGLGQWGLWGFGSAESELGRRESRAGTLCLGGRQRGECRRGPGGDRRPAGSREWPPGVRWGPQWWTLASGVCGGGGVRRGPTGTWVQSSSAGVEAADVSGDFPAGLSSHPG